MPDRDFNDIISTTSDINQISLGSAGWGDEVVANFDYLMKTYMYYGLLGAKLDVQITSSTDPVQIFSISVYDCFVHVDRLLIFRRGTTPGSTQLVAGSNASTYDNWNDGFALSSLTSDDLPLEVLPDVAGGNYSDTVANDIGIVNNEESPLSNTFQLDYLSGSDMAGAVDVYAYGALIKKGS